MCLTGAAKARLKRLEEGKHPYKEYTYRLVHLGRMGDTWECREDPGTSMTGGHPDTSSAGVVGIDPGDANLGEEVDLAFWQLGDEAWNEARVDWDDDPFGFGGDMDYA